MSKVVKIDSQSKSEFVIDGTVIRQDAAGRYCLNDFHQAAGGHNKHRPSIWMRNASVNSIIHQLALENTSASPVSVRKGRYVGGTWVARELVYSYAMWVGSAYHLKAMRAFDRVPPPDRQVMSTGVTEVKVAKPREVKSGRYDVPYGNPPAVIEQQGDELTMSSLEIAALTGKDHKHVMRDIRVVLDELGEDESKFGSIYLDAYQRQKPCFGLPRREVDILLTGYSVPLRAKVIDRWHQLEAEVAKPTFSVPTSFAEALRLAGELEEQRVALTHQVSTQAEKIEKDKPKVKVFNRLVDQEGFISFQKFCTQLNLHQRKVKAWLRDIGWLRADQWEVNPLPTAKAVDAGYCDIKRFETVNGTLKQQIVFTPKAEAYVELKAPDYIRKPVRKERKKAA